ncbi:acyltransferase [Flavobacterium adhaerens]|uniref:acyltransferase n=1 Tax=Flavobacterium adhaerens TaxID=3149043 RepID=UPI0032B42C1D
MKKYLKLVFYLLNENYKTIYFNFKYFTFKEAILFPIIISRNVYLKELKGTVVIEGKLKYGMIRIGFGEVGIFDEKKSRAILQLCGSLIFKGSAQIGHGSKLSIGKNGCLIIGNNFKITAETAIVSHEKIEFGSNCLLSWDILLMDTDFHIIRDSDDRQVNVSREIIVGDNVWIGCRSTILKGSRIPNHCVIGANSVLNSNFKIEKAIYAGIPAHLVRDNIRWTNK